ncbi:MAG TPA: hypothetical protein VGH73_13020 [Thermoanaerobaculia bacterium]
MNLLPPSPARTTTTFYSYAEKLVRERSPRTAALLLGMRWSFGLPAHDLERLAEYSLPLNPTPLDRALAQRGGLRIERHEGDGEVSLHDHLATGAPAIVAMNAYYFAFRPAYLRVHSSRTVRVSRQPGEERLRIHDSWGPAAEGTVTREELDRARFSDVPLDVNREPLFAGNPVDGVWFTVEADPLSIDDAAAWSRERLAWLYDEMAVPRADARGEYGIAALRKFRRWLENRLAEPPDTAASLAARRGASLLLRPELSSRLYLGVFLRNAAHLLGDGELQAEVERYRAGLGHLQGVMDVMTKTVRTRRPEYDDFIRIHFARACENEERLLGALARFAAD